jgi:hypothetical protein
MISMAVFRQMAIIRPIFSSGNPLRLQGPLDHKFAVFHGAQEMGANCIAVTVQRYSVYQILKVPNFLDRLALPLGPSARLLQRRGQDKRGFMGQAAGKRGFTASKTPSCPLMPIPV